MKTKKTTKKESTEKEIKTKTKPTTNEIKIPVMPPEIDRVRQIMGKTIKTSVIFRKIVSKTGKHGQVVDGTTILNKKDFLMMVKKITVKVGKITVDQKSLEEIWKSASQQAGAKEIDCQMLEKWMKLSP